VKTLTYQFELGDLTCSVIEDASRTFAIDALLANVDHEQLVQVALDFELELDKIPVDYKCLLVNVGDQYVLIDAGYGDRLDYAHGNLHQGLASLGLTPSIQLSLLTQTVTTSAASWTKRGNQHSQTRATFCWRVRGNTGRRRGIVLSWLRFTTGPKR
jgi:hypothetical protein